MANRPFSTSTLSGIYIISVVPPFSGIQPTLFMFDGNGGVWPASCPQTVTAYSIDSAGNLAGVLALGTTPGQGGCVGTASSIVGMVPHDGGVFIAAVISPANNYTVIGVAQ